MKATIFVSALLLASPATAAIYKCTDANGQVSFSDKPCEGEMHEVVPERTYRRSQEPTQFLQAAPAVQLQSIERLQGGERVTGSSPLAQVYMSFIGALRTCNREEMAKFVPAAWAKDLLEIDDAELSQGCVLLGALLPRDFNDATQVIDGDRGPIQWMSVESTTDSNGTATMTSEMTGHFIKENGVWKFDGG